MKRKIILNLAISLDGYISEKDGGFDWIKGEKDKTLDTKKKFDFSKFIGSVDIIVMGKKAYEDAPKEGMEMFKSKKILVASHSELKDKPDNIEIMGGDIVKKITELQKENGKDIWLYGGAGLTDAFVKAEVIDEYIIGVIPIILGDGRHLFLGKNPRIKLHLEEFTSQDGIVILKYARR